jgi:dual specificity tyrosine-phosphorylation-regulated kinase 2/3/4
MLVSSSPHRNLTLALTRGLGALHTHIRTGVHSAQESDHGFTDVKGVLQLCLGHILQSRYRVLRVIGDGACSRVYAVEDCYCHRSQKKQFALKALGENFAHVGRAEAEALRKVRAHAVAGGRERTHIARLHSSFSYGPHECLILDLHGPSLLDVLRSQPRMSLKSVRRVALQLTLALEELSVVGLVHADLKPENVLLPPASVPSLTTVSHDPEMGLTLVDLGNACVATDLAAKFPSGGAQTLFYRAPEVLFGLPLERTGHAIGKGKPAFRGSSDAVVIDTWSLGCLLAELISGRPLFPCQNNQELVI